MNPLGKMAALALILGVSAAVAHSKVQNEAVKARMESMSAIGSSMKALGKMAKGEANFDAGRAELAVATIVEQAEAVPALFKAPETDPETEAKPEIWSNWDDFVAKSEALVGVAQSVDTNSLTGVQAGLGKIGGTCKACHSDYRISKK
ncbi:c-type cytochrome [Actibacterium lipolyticum]|uniref:Cytochrome c-556 n=1 Tax=Actibacterium lipolyticum TaxID=1524263 RepID=A0A238JKB1_9RHOB|nr:cytochrome c [Actibacterium lipolyticum]SMX30654.1 Cytochrome c-556 [Actibacterium lipolyticum]